MFEIYTVFPRWFCAGVFRAVNMLEDIVTEYGVPIYINHEIIHNRYINEYFSKKWVIHEENIDNILEWSILVVSAHGVGPSFFTKLREKKIRYIDATCPLVEKVHREALNFIKQWHKIIYIGQKNHQEALWVQDFAPESITIISNKEDALWFLHSQEWQDSKFALLTQTTLSVDDTRELIEYVQTLFPTIEMPKAWDICYATTNRQNAVKQLSEKVDTVFIVGSKNSSNSNKLKYLAEKMWKKAYLVDNAWEILDEYLNSAKKIWISAWASGPEDLVQGVVAYLEEKWGTFMWEVRVVEEKVTFPYKIDVKS